MKISVCIPCYNAQDFVQETIDSIRNQSHEDWELVCVDDGSTDSTWKILQQNAAQDHRIRVHRLENNSGSAAYPLSVAVSHASADWVIILGNDDILQDDFLKIVTARQQETQADMVLSCFYGYRGNFVHQPMWKIPSEDFDLSQILSGREAIKLTIGQWRISANGALIRKADYITPIQLEATGEYSQMDADELTSRMAIMRAQRIAFSTAAYGYRVHASSISCNPKRSIERMKTKLSILQLFASEYGSNSAEFRLAAQDALISFARAWRKISETGDQSACHIMEQCHQALPFRLIWQTSVSFGKKIFASLPASWASCSMMLLHRLRKH